MKKNHLETFLLLVFLAAGIGCASMVKVSSTASHSLHSSSQTNKNHHGGNDSSSFSESGSKTTSHFAAAGTAAGLGVISGAALLGMVLLAKDKASST